jgi:hypothetical protein
LIQEPPSGGCLAGLKAQWQGETPGTVLAVASTIYACPIHVPGNIPVQTVTASVDTGQTDGQIRLGLYNDLNGTITLNAG